jgi:hypothetical protein
MEVNNMSWTDLEKSFIKAWSLTLSRGKIILCFFSLTLCGVLHVFCKALAVGATPWVGLSLIFLPVLLSSGLLLTLGVLLIRMYSHEVKGLKIGFARLFAGSINIAMGTTYLSMPPVIIYLFLWIALGLFFLLKEIPLIGPFFNVVFAFGPFLIIFCSLVLTLATLSLLFFVAPSVSHSTLRRLDFKSFANIQKQPFQALLLFTMGLLPVLFVGGLLTLAAVLTNQSFALQEPTVAIALEWFFVMIPFCAILAPPVVFFFHFASESYELLKR